jgi:hypothetical protein
VMHAAPCCSGSTAWCSWLVRVQLELWCCCNLNLERDNMCGQVRWFDRQRQGRAAWCSGECTIGTAGDIEHVYNVICMVQFGIK